MRYLVTLALFVMFVATYSELVNGAGATVAVLAPQDGDDLLPLHAAAASDEPDAPQAIENLLVGGADPNALDELGRTPLMLAAMHNPQRQTAAMLIKSGARVNIADHLGNTALHYSLGFFGTFGRPRNL